MHSKAQQWALRVQIWKEGWKGRTLLRSGARNELPRRGSRDKRRHPSLSQTKAE